MDRKDIYKMFGLPPDLVGPSNKGINKANAMVACGVFHDTFIVTPRELAGKIHRAWLFIHWSNRAKLQRDDWTKRLRLMIQNRSMSDTRHILKVADEVIGEVLGEVTMKFRP